MQDAVRGKWKSLLTAIITVIVIAAATTGLAIVSTVNKTVAEGIESNNVTAQISFDREAAMSKTRTNDSSSGTSGSAGSPHEKPDRDAMRKALSESSLSLDDYNKYAQSQYVKERITQNLPQ